MPNELNIGYIIAVEGIDQSGKQSQVALLAKALEEEGYQVVTFSSPDYSTVTGRKLEEFLKGYHDWDNITYQSLMAVNRYEQQERVQQALMSGKVVIFDRYIDSGMVYGMADNCDPQWLMMIQHSLIPPDAVVYIDIPVEESFRRKGAGRDVYESKSDFLETVRDIYQQAGNTLGWIQIDGLRAPDEVHRDILEQITERMATNG